MNAEESFERDALRADIADAKQNQPYVNEGYSDRVSYLRGLSEEYEVDLSTVLALADMLGPTEDFDGLVTALQDMED